MAILLQATGEVWITTLNPRIRRTPAHVILSRVAQDLSHRVRILSVSYKTVILHIEHSMSHTPSLLYPSHLSTTSHLHLHSSPALSLDHPPDLYWCHLHTEISPCADPSNCVFRSYGWNDIAYRLWAQTSHWREHTSFLVKPMFFHRPSMTSTYDSAVSIATLTSWIGLGWWANSEYVGFTVVLTGERSKCRPTTSSSLIRRKLSVQFISLPRVSAGKPGAVFLHKRKSSQEAFSDREGVSSEHQTVQGKCGTCFRFSDPEEAARTVPRSKNVKMILSTLAFVNF